MRQWPGGSPERELTSWETLFESAAEDTKRLRTIRSAGYQRIEMKILVALSGGVDSAVAALRLKEKGIDVAGVYMRTWMNEEAVFGDCPWQDELASARAVAKRLGIEFEVVNFIEEYRERVVDYMIDGYRRGITPNPDIMCNREMKFGVFRDYAQRSGFDGVIPPLLPPIR